MSQQQYQSSERPSQLEPETILIAKIIMKAIEDYQKPPKHYHATRVSISKANGDHSHFIYQKSGDVNEDAYRDARRFLFEGDYLEDFLDGTLGQNFINCDYIRRMAKDQSGWLKIRRKWLDTI